jgi:hypothetical protein
MLVRVNLTIGQVKVNLTATRQGLAASRGGRMGPPARTRVGRYAGGVRPCPGSMHYGSFGLKIVVWGLRLAPHVLILGYEYLKTSPRER